MSGRIVRIESVGVKGVKSGGLTHDGEMISCTLVVNGKPVAYCMDQGTGGGMQIDYQHFKGGKMVPFCEDFDAEASLKAYAAAETTPPWFYSPYGDDPHFTPYDAEGIVNDLIDLSRNARKFAAAAKKRVIWRDDSMPEGNYKQTAIAPAPNHLAAWTESIRKREGGKAGFIMAQDGVDAFVAALLGGRRHPVALSPEEMQAAKARMKAKAEQDMARQRQPVPAAGEEKQP